MLYHERRLRKQGYRLIVGVDEAGRGPLAGPVVAAAVILRQERFQNRIDDSKKLTPKKREKAFLELAKKCLYGVGIVNEKVIDEINILNSTRVAMKQAVEEVMLRLKKDITLASCPEKTYVIIDGNIDIGVGLPARGIIGGDRKSLTIAAASIIAKVIRDRIMAIYDREFSGYGFLRHKGYPTEHHRSTLKKLGPSPIHRLSFRF